MNVEPSNQRNVPASVHGDERGTAVMELVISFPIVIFIILLLIGLGHTLITKQQALVAARFTSQYHLIHKSSPSSGEVAQAVSAGQGQWRISVSDGESGQDSAGELSGGGGGILASVLSFFAEFVNALVGNTRQTVRVSTTPEKGLLAKLYNLNDARAGYTVEHETWTCAEKGGSYLSIMSSEINSKAGSIPLLGYITDLIDRVVGGIPCCETYSGSAERQ